MYVVTSASCRSMEKQEKSKLTSQSWLIAKHNDRLCFLRKGHQKTLHYRVTSRSLSHHSGPGSIWEVQETCPAETRRAAQLLTYGIIISKWNTCCFKSVSYGVVCYTAKADCRAHEAAYSKHLAIREVLSSTDADRDSEPCHCFEYAMSSVLNAFFPRLC